jgi:hypothetical protein
MQNAESVLNWESLVAILKWTGIELFIVEICGDFPPSSVFNLVLAYRVHTPSEATIHQ